mmetsp:Transcript_5168/g.20058  ORF Transcript_5168/g.20058 Transcript_5168/m.20058 type:complete len:103 (-) Transcript_5168:4041-4349(-)
MAGSPHACRLTKIRNLKTGCIARDRWLTFQQGTWSSTTQKHRLASLFAKKQEIETRRALAMLAICFYFSDFPKLAIEPCAASLVERGDEFGNPRELFYLPLA